MDPIIFREYDIRGRVGTHLNLDTVPQIVRGIGTFFRRQGCRHVALGWDCRLSSAEFAEMAVVGLRATGCNVLSIGEVSTPMLSYTVATKRVDAGIMITGSHNPADHNGFKISLGTASLYGEQVQEIRGLIERGDFESGLGEYAELDVVGDYLRDLYARLRSLRSRLKVVVDAGNGMGGIGAVPLYREMGAEVIELFTEPDGRFPNHHPDPTVPENLTHLIESVALHGADVGIAFDGDGDRIGVVAPNGRIVWGDELISLYSRSILPEIPEGRIIGDVKCSQKMFDEVARLGGTPIMWKTGHSLIKAKMRESGALLAGEMSGHIFFADRFYGFDDAAYAGGRLLEILDNSRRSILEELATLPSAFSTPELRVDCPEERKAEIVREVSEYFSRSHEVITIDGARILFENGWALIRASNTESILVLRFEADTPEELAEIRDSVESILLPFLDLSAAANAARV